PPIVPDLVQIVIILLAQQVSEPVGGRLFCFDAIEVLDFTDGHLPIEPYKPDFSKQNDCQEYKDARVENSEEDHKGKGVGHGCCVSRVTQFWPTYHSTPNRSQTIFAFSPLLSCPRHVREGLFKTLDYPREALQGPSGHGGQLGGSRRERCAARRGLRTRGKFQRKG